MSSIPVISPTALDFLSSTGNSGHSLDLDNNNHRTISLAILDHSSSNPTFSIPNLLNSAESLQFCGLNAQVADTLYQKWAHDQETLSSGDLGYGDYIIVDARYYLHQMSKEHDAFVATDDYQAALTAMGINETTVERIMDPGFENVRMTASAYEWALDTLNLAWEFLEGLDGRLKQAKDGTELQNRG
jgi:hypothetical protein